MLNFWVQQYSRVEPSRELGTGDAGTIGYQLPRHVDGRWR